MKIISRIVVVILCVALGSCGGRDSTNHDPGVPPTGGNPPSPPTGGNPPNPPTGGNPPNPPPASNPIKFVQAASVTLPAIGSNPISTYTATFANSVTSGDLIVLAFWWNYPFNSTIVSVTDSGENFYRHALVTPPLDSANVWIYYATNVSGGAPLSVTITVSQSSLDQFSMDALEYSGLTDLDVTRTDSGSLTFNNTISSSGDAFTHEANELIVGVSLSNDLNTTMAGTGFTSLFASNYFMVEDKTVSSAGRYDADFVLPIAGCQYCAWTAGMATFY